MARPLRISYPNAFYHVTCRGNDRRMIFRDDHDRTRFLERVRNAREIFGVRVHAYVLLSNHFHLIVETPKANLSEFMRQFNFSYRLVSRYCKAIREKIETEPKIRK